MTDIRAGVKKVPRGTGFQVVCPGCHGQFHETTTLYDIRKKAHGGMFKILPEYGPDGANWSTFQEQRDIDMGELYCPGCAALYCDSETGRVTSIVRVQKDYSHKKEHVCLMCGKEFRAKSGLATHMRHCEGKA